jgi:nitrogen fixation protein FixH
MSTTLDHDPKRGRWIPWCFVGGMALVIAVNAVLITAALTTFTGVTTGKAYDRGRAYNHVIAEAARQEALGWRAEVALAPGMLTVAVDDRDGAPVPGRAEGVLLRPLDGTTLPLDFAAAGPGRFLAAAEGLRPGQWEARVTLHGAAGTRFEIRQRVIAP